MVGNCEELPFMFRVSVQVLSLKLTAPVVPALFKEPEVSKVSAGKSSLFSGMDLSRLRRILAILR